MTRPTKPVAMCCVSIGHMQDLLMPADKGMKLVELLQSAFECRKHYGDRAYAYELGEQPHVELALVKPQQIRAPKGPGAAAAPLLLGDQS